MEHAVALSENNLVLGRYRPLRPLGSGGAGSVWLARDEQADREVALKIVAREGKAGARAEREVEAATRLRHPRCLRALALARDEGHVYVAYPFISGCTLRDALRGGALDDWSSVEAAAQILEALAHAHSKGVIHRDVKPANVMVEDTEEVSIRLLDFGMAQIDEADTLTAAGDVPGTLAYIAPERMRGAEATGAADVWSLGVILWEALAGRHPFWAVSPLETARRVEQGAQPLAELRPDLPRKLCRAVDRMLANDPGKRPTARQALHLLRSVEEDRSERRRAVSSPARLQEQGPHAVLAAAFAGGSAFLLPFFPGGWPFLLGALAGLLALVNPRVGLAAALAVPILPLGNVSLGLALAYVPLAIAWLVLFARDARSGLLFVAGPVLALLHLLPLMPVVALQARGAVRQAALAARRRAGGRRNGDRRRGTAASDRAGRAGDDQPPRHRSGLRRPSTPSRVSSRAGPRCSPRPSWSSRPRWPRGRPGSTASGASQAGARDTSGRCSSLLSRWAASPSPPPGLCPQPGSQRVRWRIRCFERVVRVPGGHNGVRFL